MKGSLQVKGKKYYAVFRIDGKLKWHNLNVEAKRGTKREAERAMADLVAQYDKEPTLFTKTDFVSYIKLWLEAAKRQINPITYEGYEQYAERHIIPYFLEKKLALQDVKVKDIEGYYYDKATTGRLDGKPGGLSSRSIKLHSVVLSMVFKKEIREGLTTSNPCEYAQIPKTEGRRYVASFYTVGQCKKLLDVVEGTPLHDMIYLTTLYGLRRSELLGLKWDAVDFEKNTIAIRHTVVLQGVVVSKDGTKNKTSNRVYPLLDDVREILCKIQREQGENRKLFGNCYVESGYIFTKADGSPYYPSYPSNKLHRVLEKYDLDRIRWHDLRHTTASMLILKGWQMKEISEWLGHSDIGTTMNIYGHLDMQHKRELGNTLNGLFKD